MPATLLLADDSVTIQRVIELTFAHEGVRVVSVSDGRQAIRWIDIERPDIVLVDVGLPQVDGYDVASHVKQSPALRHIPVLLLTGAFEPIDEARARATGCDGILIKPFEPKQLVSRVKDLLAGHKPAPVWPAEDLPLNQPASRSAFQPEPEAVIVIEPLADLEFEVLDDGLDRLDPTSAPAPGSRLDLGGAHEFQAPQNPFGMMPDPPASAGASARWARPGFAVPMAAVPMPDVAMPPPPLPEPVEDPIVVAEAPMSAHMPVTPLPEVSVPERPAVATFEGEGGSGWTGDLTEAEMLVAEPLTPPTSPLWDQGLMTTRPPAAPPPAPAPLVQVPVTLSLANAFSALLTAERAQPAALAPQVTEEAVEDVVRKVLTRLTGEMVRSVVVDTAERLVRQEIDKIKTDSE